MSELPRPREEPDGAAAAPEDLRRHRTSTSTSTSTTKESSANEYTLSSEETTTSDGCEPPAVGRHRLARARRSQPQLATQPRVSAPTSAVNAYQQILRLGRPRRWEHASRRCRCCPRAPCSAAKTGHCAAGARCTSDRRGWILAVAISRTAF